MRKIVWKRPLQYIWGTNAGPVGYVSASVRHFQGYKDPETNEFFKIPYDPTITHLEPVYDYPSNDPKDWHQFAKPKKNLLTNAGKDYYHAQIWTNTSAGGLGVNFIALSESTLTPAVTDTTLGGEITTNGLQRVVSTTLSHTPASNTTTLSKTFTASGSFTDVKASALFNAASTGTMGHIAILVRASPVVKDSAKLRTRILTGSTSSDITNGSSMVSRKINFALSRVSPNVKDSSNANDIIRSINERYS